MKGEPFGKTTKINIDPVIECKITLNPLKTTA